VDCHNNRDGKCKWPANQLPDTLHGVHKVMAGRDGAPRVLEEVPAGTGQKDCPDSQPDTDTWLHDCVPDMWLLIRTFRDTGPSNDYGCRPCPTDTQYLVRTLGDSPHRDHPGTGADKYRRRSNTVHWDRMVRADKGHRLRR